MNKPRGRPFAAGNRYGKGRPRGSRNKTTRVAQQILDQYSESLIRQGIVLAAKGNVPLLKFLLERMLPVRRDGPVRLKLRKIETAQDIIVAGSEIVEAISAGKITPQEGERVTEVLERIRKCIEVGELAARVEELERIEGDRQIRGG